MPQTSPPTGRGPLCDTALDAWIGREAKDVPPGWIDHAIRRLFELWNVLMIKLEDAKNGAPSSNDADSRARDARTLVQVQRSLAELIRYETARAGIRKTKVSEDHAETRAVFDRRMDQLALASGAPEIPRWSDE